MKALLRNKVVRFIGPVMMAMVMIFAMMPATTKADYSSDIQNSIVGAAYAYQYSPAPSGYCASWVTKVYAAAGYTASGNACDMWAMVANTGSADINDIMPGMIIATPSCSFEPGSAGWNYGHVGIYVGDGMVMHSTQGSVWLTDIYTWMSNYANHCDSRPIMWGYSWDVPYEVYYSYDMYYDDYSDDNSYESSEEDYYYSDEADYTGIFGDGRYAYTGISEDGYYVDEGYQISVGARYYSDEVYSEWLSLGAPYTGYGTAYILDASGNTRELIFCSSAYGAPGDYVDFYLSSGAVEHAAILGNIEDYSGVCAAADDWGFSGYNLVYLAQPSAGETYEVYDYLGGAVITGYTVY